MSWNWEKISEAVVTACVMAVTLLYFGLFVMTLVFIVLSPFVG